MKKNPKTELQKQGQKYFEEKECEINQFDNFSKNQKSVRACCINCRDFVSY